MSSYRVIREIGRGGFGVVEEVTNARGEHFARKTFRPSPGIPTDAHEGLRKRFRREVKTQEALGGREILPVLASDLEADIPWFIMPLAERTYDQQIAVDRASGSVNIDAVADILNGLEVLHSLDYVHRDLNPKNILLHDGHWKLSDLGAVLPPTGHTVTLTEDTIIYTELYCSPEQRVDFHKAQTAADVFSFGCILHDIFGTPPRTPYAQQHAPGDVGLIIEKCTEHNPARRPTIPVLRPLLLETLVEMGGHCRVEDQQAESWLNRLDSIGEWQDEDFAAFARFFADLDLTERSEGHEAEWVYSLSTPFLTRLPAEALARIVSRCDGIAGAIVEKYCDWVRRTNFLFHYSDIVCGRLAAIFDAGSPSIRAQAAIAMLELAESHNRWYVMRELLTRCSGSRLTKEEARRIEIDIRSEEMVTKFRRCVGEITWDRDVLAPDIARLCA